MEIERKFRVIRENLFEKLHEGEYFAEKHEVTFLDEYFDNPSFLLTVNDHWLRRRSLDLNRAAWELKYGKDRLKETARGRHCTRYMETSDTQQIATRIG